MPRSMGWFSSLRARAFAANDVTSYFYARFARVVTTARAGGGIAAAAIAVFAPDLTGRDEVAFFLLIAGFYLPYTALLYLLPVRPDRLNRRIVWNAVGDVLLIALFYEFVPSIRNVVLLGGLIYTGIYAVTTGLRVGLPVALGLIGAVGVIEALAAPAQRLPLFTTAMFAVVLVLFTVILDMLTEERRGMRRQLELLSSTLQVVAAGPPIEETLHSIAAAARRAVQGRFVALFLVEGSGFVLGALDGMDPEEQAMFRGLAERFGRSALVDRPMPSTLSLQTGEPIVVPDVARFPTYEPVRDDLARLGLRASVIVPLGHSGNPVGTLNVYFAEVGMPFAGDVEVLASYSSQAGVAIRGALMVEREREADRMMRSTEELKSQFLGMVTHELKTPLTAARGLLDMALTAWDRFDDPERREMLERATDNISRLRHIVGQILELSRLGGGEVALRIRPVDLTEELNRIIDRIDPSVLRRAEVRRDLPEGLQVMADPLALEHVLSNLLSNAAKYSAPETPITVSARADGSEAVVAVEDAGPGLSAAELEHVFDRFYQTERSRKAALPGTGIGLSLVRSYVELLGGRVWAQARPQGGSSFAFTLPRAGISA